MGQGGGQGGVDGRGHQRAHWFHFLGSLKNLTIGLIWLVTRGGGVGGVGQGGGQRGGRWGGAPESSVGATRRSLVPLLGLPYDLAGDEGGRCGGCGPGRRARGGRWRGAPESWAREAGKGG